MRVLGLGVQGEGPRFRRAGWVRLGLGQVVYICHFFYFTPGNPVS